SCLIHIRNARNCSPHAPCSTITGRKASIKEYSLPAQTVEKRRGIKFVSVSRCFICAEGLANYEHYVTGLFRPFCYPNPAGKIKVNRVGLVDAQVLYHQRIGCLNFFFIKSRFSELQRTEKGLERIQCGIGCKIVSECKSI